MTRCNGYWSRGKHDVRWYTADKVYRLSKQSRGAGWRMDVVRLQGWSTGGTFATMDAAKDAAERGTL